MYRKRFSLQMWRNFNQRQIHINSRPLFNNRSINSTVSIHLLQLKQFLIFIYFLFYFFSFSVEVVLGEYDLTKDIDCEFDDDNEEICSPPTQTYGIEKIIPHEEFSFSSYSNDIALIRLNATVNTQPRKLKSNRSKTKHKQLFCYFYLFIYYYYCFV